MNGTEIIKELEVSENYSVVNSRLNWREYKVYLLKKNTQYKTNVSYYNKETNSNIELMKLYKSIVINKNKRRML